jgi:hypothetical protein
MHLIMIHVIMFFFSINETSFFFLLIDAFLIDASSTIYQLFILSINVFARRLHSNDLNFQFINTSQRFFENESDWFQRSEESTSWNRLASLIISFSVLFLTATRFLSISAWILILMIKFDFSNLLISTTLKLHIELHSISKKFSRDCWEKVSLVKFVLRKINMSLIIQFSLLSLFFSIASWRIISNVDTLKSFNATSKIIVVHTIFLSTRNVILIITRE